MQTMRATNHRRSITTIDERLLEHAENVVCRIEADVLITPRRLLCAIRDGQRLSRISESIIGLLVETNLAAESFEPVDGSCTVCAFG